MNNKLNVNCISMTKNAFLYLLIKNELTEYRSIRSALTISDSSVICLSMGLIIL